MQGNREANPRLIERVRKVLWDYEPLRASGSTVQVGWKDEAIHLSGRVRTLALKQIAEQLARDASPDENVLNDLISDTEVIRAVADELAADPVTRPYVIRVDSRLGEVTLYGIVPSMDVERRAMEVASAMPVVVHASSELEVDPQSALAAVASTGENEGETSG